MAEDLVAPPPPLEIPIPDRLEAFIRHQIVDRSVRRIVRAPVLQRCARVMRVAPASIAGRAGVRPGALMDLPEAPDGLTNPHGFGRIGYEQQVAFTSPAGIRIELRTRGAPLGVDLKPTVQSLVAAYAAEPRPELLLETWKLGEWRTLERMCTVSTEPADPLSKLTSGMFGRFIGASPQHEPDLRATQLFRGVALVEQGRAEGLELVKQYLSSDVDQAPRDFLAVAHYALALHLRRAKKDKEAADALRVARSFAPLQRLLEGLSAMRVDHSSTGGPPRQAGPGSTLPAAEAKAGRAWKGHAFPAYRLRTADRKQQVSLGDALTGLGKHLIHVVCVLGDSAGNEQYLEFCTRFLNFIVHCHAFVHGMHVITAQAGPDPRFARYFAGQNRLLEKGAPVKVLIDEGGRLLREVDPPGLPTIYALDRDGTVLQEGAFDAVDLWDCLYVAAVRRSGTPILDVAHPPDGTEESELEAELTPIQREHITQVIELGELLGYHADRDVQDEGFSCHAVWRRIKSGKPTHAFGAPLGDDPSQAIAQVVRARERWGAKVFLITPPINASVCEEVARREYPDVAEHIRVLAPTHVSEFIRLKRQILELEKIFLG